MPNNIILVTGFGPFHGHKINASWEAVKLIPSHYGADADIEKIEIPVSYIAVDTNVPRLWKEYNPVLVVHVGVSSEARKISIESKAFRTGYFKIDCTGMLHKTNEVCSADDGEDCVTPNLDVEKICNALNENSNIKACLSQNAGRYLCEYIFYKSLSIDAQRTLFIHVPPLNNPYTADELAQALFMIIQCALEQLHAC